MQISITQTGTPPLTFQKNIRFQFVSVQEGMVVLAEQTRDHMRDIIRHRERGVSLRPPGSGNLEKAINVYVEESPDVFTVGIGSIPELNNRAPYWYLINYGGMSTIAARGMTLYGNFNGSPPDSSLAGTGVGNQTFNQSLPAYPMTPKSPIAGKHYIELTANWLATVWRVYFSGKTGNFKVGGFKR